MSKISVSGNYQKFFLLLRRLIHIFFIFEYKKEFNEVCFEHNFFQNFNVLGGHRYPKWAPLAQNLETKFFITKNSIYTIIPSLKPKDRHLNQVSISIGC